MNEEQLKEYIHQQIKSFAGREDNEETSLDMKNLLIKIINENPDKLDFIHQVLKEGYANDNT